MATRFLRGCWLVMVMTAPLLAADGPGATQPAVDALAFPMPAPDPIERPEFQKRPHPITKAVTSATAMMVRIANDGSMLGMTSDIIASVPAESRSSAVSVANLVTKQAQVMAYANDFHLLLLLCIPTAILVLLMRRPAALRPAGPGHAAMD